MKELVRHLPALLASLCLEERCFKFKTLLTALLSIPRSNSGWIALIQALEKSIARHPNSTPASSAFPALTLRSHVVFPFSRSPLCCSLQTASPSLYNSRVPSICLFIYRGAQVPSSTAEDVEAAVDSARVRCFPTFADSLRPVCSWVCLYVYVVTVLW